MPKNLTELNEILFKWLDRLQEEGKTGLNMEMEIEKSKQVAAIGKEIVNSHKLTLEALKMMQDGEVKNDLLPKIFLEQRKLKAIEDGNQPYEFDK